MGKRTGLKRAPQATDKHVGRRIRMRRHMLDISQQWLGGAIGVTFQQIQKYENGRNRVGASRLQQIADALHCQPAWFFEGRLGSTGNNRNAGDGVEADIAAFLAEKHALNLVRDYVRLAPELKRAIVKMVMAAAGQPEEA